MKKKSSKIIFIILLFLSATGICTAFYMYNKGPLDVKNKKGIEIKANDLYSIFKTDTIMANNMYTGKILEVSGVLTEISLNQQQQQVVLLKTGTMGASVNCTMESADPRLKPLDKVVIKGICSGMGQADIELGIPADVYLSRCYSKNANAKK